MTASTPTSPEQEADPRLPTHVAIIMDGNGRWAKARGQSRIRGHEQGAESVRAVVEACRRRGIRYLTLYAFSNENWARPRSEVKALMSLLGRFLKKERADLLEKDIRLNAIGDIARLPPATRSLLEQVMTQTAGCRAMVLTLALSYGGRQEILQAVRRLCRRAAAGELDPEALDQEIFSGRLYTAGLPDPDLLIRTSGELRLSNFLLWQSAYTEFYFTDLYWPDFREEALDAALADYARRQRRFGLTGEQAKNGAGR